MNPQEQICVTIVMKDKGITVFDRMLDHCFLLPPNHALGKFAEASRYWRAYIRDDGGIQITTAATREDWMGAD